mmetsp:Transcript_426/g.398  ORF Transcript_426/g.398 Transcript_426/m.398 type:complete len:355 (+) Transcript_426:62-1126(+)
MIKEEPEPDRNRVDGFLNQYETLRLDYEQEGISQPSILLLQRKAKEINNDPRYPNIDQAPVLRELLNISKTLMLNDFEIIVWMIWLKLLGCPDEEDKIIDYLQIIALFVKEANNPKSLYEVFEKFYSHNHPHFYARFKSSERPNINLNSADINYNYKEITKNFDYKKEKTIKDYNFEVDALEAEHDKREVHTTTKFEDDKLKKMEEEAKKSNALLNYGKKKTKIKEEKTTPTNKRTRKMADKELEQIKEDIEGGKDLPKVELPKEISGVKIEKFKDQAIPFKPPSFNSKGGDQVGFMPISSIEGKLPTLNAQSFLSNNISDHQGSKAFHELFNGNHLQNDLGKDKNGSIKYLKL